MAVAQQELCAARQHQLLARLEGVGDELDGAHLCPRLEAAQPARKERERKDVRRGEEELVRGRLFRRLHLLASLREPRQHFFRDRPEDAPGLRERGGVGAAVA